MSRSTEPANSLEFQPPRWRIRGAKTSRPPTRELWPPAKSGPARRVSQQVAIGMTRGLGQPKGLCPPLHAAPKEMATEDRYSGSSTKELRTWNSKLQLIFRNHPDWFGDGESETHRDLQRKVDYAIMSMNSTMQAGPLEYAC